MATGRIRAGAVECMLKHALILLLLASVPGLSTLAKVSWYLPQSDPGHYLTTAIKMKVVGGRALPNTDSLQPIGELAVFSPQVESRVATARPPELSIPRMVLRAVLLHRSPPREAA